MIDNVVCNEVGVFIDEETSSIMYRLYIHLFLGRKSHFTKQVGR